MSSWINALAEIHTLLVFCKNKSIPDDDVKRIVLLLLDFSISGDAQNLLLFTGMRMRRWFLWKFSGHDHF